VFPGLAYAIALEAHGLWRRSRLALEEPPLLSSSFPQISAAMHDAAFAVPFG